MTYQFQCRGAQFGLMRSMLYEQISVATFASGNVSHVQLDDLSVIYSEVLQSLSTVSVNDCDNTIVIGTHNAAFGNREKAQTSYRCIEIVTSIICLLGKKLIESF